MASIVPRAGTIVHPVWYTGAMIIKINDQYFAWASTRISDVAALLKKGAPFTAFAGHIHVQSNGTTTTVRFDGRSAVLPNEQLHAVLLAAQESLLRRFDITKNYDPGEQTFTE